MNGSYLFPTEIIDSDSYTLISFAKSTIDRIKDPVQMAVKLYYAVRDEIVYDPYSPFYRPEHYRASLILDKKRGYCVSKAVLLCALARVCGIPSRLGFATVRNHLATKQLIEIMGTNIFVYHGYSELYLEGQWVKATPAFNIQLCERHGAAPLEFDGREDSIFQPYNDQNQQFMEYLEYHGTFADLPLDRIVAAWRYAYGDDRVDQWIALHEQADGVSIRDFLSEETVR